MNAILMIVFYLPGPSLLDKSEVDLYRYLMNADRYESAVRPTTDHRLSTNVTFGFLLHQVINVDEKNQQLTTSSWMNVNWIDQRLCWNHSAWGGVKILHIPNEKVWKPDLILTNNADPEYKESVVSTDIFVTPEGNVTWLFFAIYQSACQIRVRFYPFDDQECNLTFASWSYDGNNVNLLLLTEDGDLSNYVNNSEWAILGMTAHRRVRKFSVGDAPWPVITITVHLGRRPLFYVFNHIIPCILITSMSMLGFYIPAETGEKVTMCITTLLSMGVFLKTITENMPPSSEAVPLIGMYYVVSLFIVCAATVVNVITLNVHNRGSKNTPNPIPTWARWFILGHMARWVCVSIYPSDAQMFHLAEKRRRLDSDAQLLNEITVQALSAQTTANSQCDPSPIVLREHGFQEADPSSLQQDRPVTVQTTYPRAESTKSNCGSNPPRTRGRRARSIYDKYEIESLRKLSTQATLISGALSLMKAPLDESQSTKSKLSTSKRLINRLSTKACPLNDNRYSRKLEVGHNCAHSNIQSPQSDQSTGPLKMELENNFCRLLKKVYQTLEQNDLRMMLQDERSQIMWEWKQLAIIVDRTLLLLFVIATALTTFLLLFERAIFEDHLNQNQYDVPPVI